MIEIITFCIVCPSAVVLGSILHEGAHWAMAAALRCDPRVVCLGHGRQLLQVRALGVDLVLRARPFGGHVLMVPMGRDRRNAWVAVIAAGPAANIVVAIAAILAWRAWGGEEGGLAIAFPTVAVVQCISLSFTLLPALDPTDADSRQSDGYKLLAWATGRDEDFLAKAYAPIVARLPPEDRPAMTPDFAEVLFHAVRPDRAEPWGRQQAIDGIRAVLARDRLNPAERRSTQKTLQLYLEEASSPGQQEPPPEMGPWGPRAALGEDGITG